MICHLRTIVAVALGAGLLAAPVAAQTGSLTGTVVDEETGAPLADVAVEVLGAQGAQTGGVFTGNDGTFRIQLPPGSYSVVFSNLGYESERLNGVRVTASGAREVTVELASTALQLNPVVVTASRREEKALESPASISIVPEETIAEQSAPTAIEHIKGTAGVDIAQTGIQQNNVVTRGFNNVFSGSLLVMVDNRYARVPSLRFNAYNLIPTPNLDVERIELVRGPGSALYGPNAAQGVMHIITSSPIDDPGTEISLTSGFRSETPLDQQDVYDAEGRGIYQGVLSSSHRLGDDVGLRVSGQWFQGTDWLFVDNFEQNQAQQNPNNPLIGRRLPTAERWSSEARLDYRPWNDGEVILSAGVNHIESSVELTGLGAAQARDWQYRYVQTRVRKGRFFGQFFLNSSNAGNDPADLPQVDGTYLLRTGNPIVDQSRFLAGQLQHGYQVSDALDLIYGLDYQRTDPRTGGTITGSNEDSDQIDEVGGYVHGELDLTDQVDLVAALRVDNHSELDGVNVSPRAALVFRPTDAQNLRFTFNRAFSTPTTNNLFLDIQAGRIPVTGNIGYDIRSSGVPDSGFTFQDQCPGGIQQLCMRSPFAQGQLPATAAPFWNALIQQLAPQSLQPLLTDPGAQPGDPSLGSLLRRFDQVAAQTGQGDLFPVDPEGPQPIEPIESTIWNTLEVGYKGLINDRFLVQADVYRSDVKDFVGPLRVETPNVFLDPQTVQSFVVKRLQPLLQSGMVTQQQVAQIVEGLSSVPVGTVVPDQRNDPDLILTYRNFGDVSLWGTDLSVRLLASDRWTFGATYSWVSEECFDFNEDGDCTSAVDIALNAPQNKGSLSARYDNKVWGLAVEARTRFVQDFIMNSGVYVGEIAGYGVVDANVAYTLPFASDATVSITGTNLLDNLHQEFIGAPRIGRMVLARLLYRF